MCKGCSALGEILEERRKLVFESILRAKEEESQAFHQRALFVWGFLMVCLAAYAVLAHDVLLCKDISANRITIVNDVMMALALIMVRLAIYWIQMNKGASAWAENYDYIAENFLHRHLRIDGKSPVSDPQGIGCIGRADIENGPGLAQFDEIFSKKNCDLCKGNPTYACIFSVLEPSCQYSPELDANVLTVRAGTYSPRKISILISRMALWISLVLLVLNSVISIKGPEWVKDFFLGRCGRNFFLGICAISLLILLIKVIYSFVCVLLLSIKTCCHEEQSQTLSGVQKICKVCKGKGRK